MNGRTGKQCRERYKEYLDPNINKSEWSVEEDNIITKLHEKYGNKWTTISRNMKGRSPNMIKNRWNSYLSKINLEKFSWSNEENNLLIEMHRKYGNKWSLISKKFPGRSPRIIRLHWDHFLKNKLIFQSSPNEKPIKKEKFLSHISDDNNNPYNLNTISEKEYHMNDDNIFDYLNIKL